MRRFLKILITGVFIIVFFIFLKSFYIEHYIIIKDEKMSWDLKYKGVKEAVDFSIDEKENFYIAYPDRIQLIDSKGKSYYILKDKSLSIKSLEFKDNKLYYSSSNKVFCYDLIKNEQKLLVDDIPNFGDYSDSKLKIKGNELYITIGAATNSGIVGTDNMWLQNNPFNYDISPKDITVRGKQFGSEKTGAFVPYKTKNVSGQLIPGHFPGNASIVVYNITNGTLENYAWGIRNVKGMAFKSDGKLIAAVGGMEDRGLRAVKGDVDYIYEIKKNLWYGWPDYSGGDPITSPRFKGQSKLSFILDNHPTTNPPAPIYLHKSVSTLGVLDVDIKGTLGEKDCIFFYDTRDNMIYTLTSSGVLSEEAAFKKKSKINSIKIYSNSIFILDSSEGTIFSIHNKDLNKSLNLYKDIIYYLLSVIIIAIILTLWKLIRTVKK